MGANQPGGVLETFVKIRTHAVTPPPQKKKKQIYLNSRSCTRLLYSPAFQGSRGQKTCMRKKERKKDLLSSTSCIKAAFLNYHPFERNALLGRFN